MMEPESKKSSRHATMAEMFKIKSSMYFKKVCVCVWVGGWVCVGVCVREREDVTCQ